MADTNAGPPSGSSSRIDELRARWEGDRSSRIFLQLAEELRRHQRVDEALAVLEVGVEPSRAKLHAHRLLAAEREATERQAPGPAPQGAVGIDGEGEFWSEGSSLLEPGTPTEVACVCE